MSRTSLLTIAFATLLLGNACSSVQAFDPNFGFLYGYSLGQAYQFRNRLPTPPYFSVYPPVYYGERYARPYGESPFASWPLLSAGDDYRPRPTRTPVHYSNPYVECREPGCSPTPTSPSVVTTPATTVGFMVTVENPFVTVDQAVVTK